MDDILGAPLRKGVFGWGNRGWLDITYSILVACRGGTLKTHVMYSCNLNSEQVQQYTQMLLERGLLVRTEEYLGATRAIYRTTQAGKRYIEVYNELENTLEQGQSKDARDIEPAFAPR